MATNEELTDSQVEFADKTDTELVEPTFPDTHDLSEVKAQALAVLRANRGVVLTAQDVEQLTDYSEGWVRENLHSLAESESTDVEKRRTTKEIYGVIIGGSFVPVTNDRDQLLKVVKKNRKSKFGAAKAMGTEELRELVTKEIADAQVTSTTDKLYFGIPA